MNKTDKSLWYNKYYEYQNERQLERLERLSELLPHGSGINGNWHFKYSGHNRILASNCFSAMNESGMYCHDYNFTARIQYNGLGKSKPCEYCQCKGYRTVDEIANIRNENPYLTMGYLYSQGYKIDPHGRFTCNNCQGNGYTVIPEYEFISLNFHGQREYSCCGYDLKNYLSDNIAECLSYNQTKG